MICPPLSGPETMIVWTAKGTLNAEQALPEEIIGKLREVEIVLAQGASTAEACRRIGASASRPIISMDGSPFASGIETFCVDQLQTSIRRQLVVQSAQWEIRTRAPLQLVGLKGLDNSQGSSRVGSISAVHFRHCKLSGSSGGGAVLIARSKHGPDYPCILVGDGNRCAVEPASLPKLVGPLADGIIFIAPFSRRHARREPIGCANAGFLV